MIGRTISHYKILQKLGGGGMGVVYKAEDTQLKRTVALKFLPPEMSLDEDSKTRFVREAQAASALDHPNICTIHEIGETPEGQMFICMAYYEGETLKKKIAQGLLAVDDSVNIARKIARGLSKAHGEGMVHRDIKPANLMMTNEGVVKIVDFGLAKLAGRTKVTKTGTTVGTLAYMSPEQTKGEEIDARSDIFSLGVVTYELLTGHLPFRGEHEAAVSYAVVNEDPIAPRVLRPAIPEALERVVMRCLEKDPEKRFQSAEEVAAELGKMRSHGAKPKSRLGYRWWAIAGAAAIVLIAGVLGLSRWLLGDRTPLNAKSIAVLPFKNLSDDPANEYFSDGITEDILTQLSKIADLTVVSRTSVMSYKNTEKKLREIGKELGVATILEGSVRRSDDRVRIVSQLIDAQSDKHLWAETYDRELADIFEIQSDVAGKIAAALEVKFSPKERERIKQRPTGDLAAYDYYLQGREYLRRYNRQDNERAIGLFHKALEIDPNYALAYAGIAGAYSQRVHRFGFADAWVDSAIAVAEKALSIDPDLAEAHVALGNAYFSKGWFRKALEPYRRAIEIKPNHYSAVNNIGVVHGYLGETVEQLRWYKKSMVLDPTNGATPNNIAVVYKQIGDYAKAEQWYQRALEIEPDYSRAEFRLSYVYLMQGKDRQALGQIEKALSKYPDNVWGLQVAGDVTLFLGRDAQAKAYFEKLAELVPESNEGRYANIHLGYLLWKAGEKDEARKRLSRSLTLLREESEQGSKDRYVLYDIASIHAAQGEKAEACEWLQKSIDAGYRDVRSLSMDPLFEALHDDARFKEMIAQLQTKVDEIRKEIEAMD
jgi:serine/threonine protein kinase/Flp pilus assembly protein TadD